MPLFKEEFLFNLTVFTFTLITILLSQVLFKVLPFLFAQKREAVVTLQFCSIEYVSERLT